MANVISRGTLFPPELSSEMFNLIKGRSSLSKLSAADPVPFNGTDIFTFNFDNEVSILGENEAKVNGGATISPVSVRPYKFEYGMRVSDEFVYAGEETRLQILQAFSEGFASRAARGLDIAAFHGLNPRSASASSAVGSNHFDVKITQKVNATSNANDDVESAIALVQAADFDVTGMAMAPSFRSSLAKLKKTDGSPLFPELGWGAAPGTINGLSVDVNSTLSFGGSTDLALVGNFHDYFRWGYARQISVEVIEYGNPDNDATAGDLKGHNQVYLRGECYIGWGILAPAAFALIANADGSDESDG